MNMDKEHILELVSKMLDKPDVRISMTRDMTEDQTQKVTEDQWQGWVTGKRLTLTIAANIEVQQ